MARDRLAALRAQQQQGGRGGYGDYSAPAQPAGGNYDDGYQAQRPNPYAQQDGGRYEMNEVPRSNINVNGGGDDLSGFYAEISSIQDALKGFNDNVNRIGDLQSLSLNNMDENAAQRNASQLEALVSSTSQLSTQLKSRIKALERQGGSGRDAQVRSQQTAFVKQKFVDAIRNYQQVEQQYRTKYKQRMERQFKIVKPDASPEEVRAVVNDEQGGQIFSQALLNSNRIGESRAAYREVQERHADIKKIEKTLTELAQLFNDMSVLVEQQDESVNVIHTNAVNIDTDVAQGLDHTEKAVVSARAARKKRWICFFLIILILVVIAAIAAAVVCTQGHCTSQKSS